MSTSTPRRQGYGLLPYFYVVALLIALGFEFSTAFHDTANAVATVIYTTAAGGIAVMWSGFFQFSSACCCRAARLPSHRLLLPAS